MHFSNNLHMNCLVAHQTLPVMGRVGEKDILIMADIGTERNKSEDDSA